MDEDGDDEAGKVEGDGDVDDFDFEADDSQAFDDIARQLVNGDTHAERG